VQHSPEGSEIAMAITSRSIEVSNPAPDLSDADLDHIFERHWRGDSARSDSSRSGLGLSLANAAAKASRLGLNARMQDGCLTVSVHHGG